MNKEPNSIIVWRFVRGMVAAGLAQVLVSIDFSNLDKLQALLTNPGQTEHVLLSAFIGGLLLSASKWARNQSDNTVVQNMPV